MKTKIIFFLLLIALIYSCTSTSTSFTKNREVLENDVLYADEYYYSQAVNEYDAVRHILFGLSTNKNGERSLLGGLLNSNNSGERNLLKKGYINCTYTEPTKLADLDGGFQFRQYFFTNENKAALNAFGIASSNVDSKRSYLVIDYLQYKDISCYKIPTIRYAGGIRAELTIHDSKSIFKGAGVGSLAGLAMDVENKRKKIDISIKTIGITGLDSRVPLPENNNFDIATFADLKAVITFLKTMKDKEGVDGEIKFAPQVIPVLDKYRANFESSIYANIDKMNLLQKSIEKNTTNDLEWKKNLLDTLQKHTKELYTMEVKRVIENKKRLTEYADFVHKNSSIKSLQNVDLVVKQMMVAKANDFVTNETKLQAVAYQIKTNNLDKAKKLLNDCEGEECNRVKSLLSRPIKEIKSNDKDSIIKSIEKFTNTEVTSVSPYNEKWIYLGAVDSSNKITESNVSQLNIGSDFTIEFKDILTAGTDINIRNMKPIFKDSEWIQGNIIDILKEKAIFVINGIEKIPGKDEGYYIWVKIN
ncbi:hypothetical protein [Chryseobacterium binzhouense]|uniref:hypothetical protein n=1 Tax=Chryseobacterium binzhouense TaxID=2593646 RepID=UPI00117FDE3F|nr:hypothetical protein [Chryseobacterium binzhouense]